MTTKDDKASPAGANDAPTGDEGKSEEDYWNEARKAETHPGESQTFRAVTDEDDGAKRQDDDPPPDDTGSRSDDENHDDDANSPTSQDEDGTTDDDGDKTATTASLMQKYKSDMGRANGAAKRAARYLKELEAIDSDAAARLKKDTTADGNEDDDGEDDTAAIDKIAEEYGDVVGPVIDRMKSLEKRLEDLSSSKTAVNEQRREEVTAELNAIYDEAESEFQKVHPDGMKVVEDNRDVFLQWVEDQPKILRDIFANNKDHLVDGVGAALLVSKFKEAIGQADDTSGDSDHSETQHRDKRQRQMDGARSTRSKGRQPATSEPAPDAPEEEWWNHMSKQEKRARA